MFGYLATGLKIHIKLRFIIYNNIILCDTLSGKERQREGGTIFMKNVKRRVHALFLAVVMMITGVLCYYTPATEVSAAGSSKVIFHYQREDKNYDGWDIYCWEAEPSGGAKAVAFTAEDSYGKIAIYETSADISSLGFIVRQGGADWSSKDIADDRFVTVTNGVAEVWLTSGVESYDITAPAGYEPFDMSKVGNTTGESTATPTGEGDLSIRLHYHRYDEIYDNWNVWMWPEAGDGERVDFTGADEFGPYLIKNVDASVAKYGFIVRLNEWDQKDCDMDRFIDTTKAVDGVVDVWIVQADETIYYDYSEVDLSPRFLGASLVTAKRIAVKTTTPIDTEDPESVKLFTVKDTDGNEYEIMNVFSTAGVSSSFNINMQEPLDLGKSYVLSSEEYGETAITFGEVYSSSDFEEAYTYEGDDLGANWSADSTTFKVWSPSASKIVLNLYDNGTDGDAYETVEMTRGEKGVWEATVSGDLNKVYYTYTITNAGAEREAVDLYARTTGVNGKRGMVINLASTNPDGWENDKRPEYIKSNADAIIYELHIRDFTIDESSGVTNKGKYIGLAETGTKNSAGLSTALDYIVDLGITHVQVLPMYDYSPNSVDETKLDQEQFNWGYDPYNYNAPEGSYSTDPYNGEVRINEMKQMIQAFHANDIGVIMDVVYNHTAESENSYFQMTVPDYFYRMTEDGNFSNASGCGNEVASNRSMVRKYIVDSVVYWASEYHIDGFRFDLMGIHDIETMIAVRDALHEIDPDIMVYGEGWTGGDSTLSAAERAMKVNVELMDKVGAFSDDIRDGIKGSVFDKKDKGFATGKSGQEERIKSGVVGATPYEGINWSATGTDLGASWTASPVQAINYVSCHDNLTLWDKLSSSNPDDTDAVRLAMNKLSASIVYTAQGVPFMLSGEEILRSKPNDTNTGFVENSYKSSDYTNSIKWDTLSDELVADSLAYYKGLIAFRKAHAGLRMTTAEDVSTNLVFLSDLGENVVGFVIENQPNNECSDVICVIYNANTEAVDVKVPDGEWKVCIKNGVAGTDAIETFTGNSVKVDGISCLAMVQGDLLPKDTVKDDSSSFPTGLIVLIVVIVLILIAGIVFFIIKKKGNKKEEDAADVTTGATATAAATTATTDVEAAPEVAPVVTPVEELGIIDVSLEEVGEDVAAVIATLVETTDLTTEEATAKTQAVPVIIKSGLSATEAASIKVQLEAVGAKVTLH